MEKPSFWKLDLRGAIWVGILVLGVVAAYFALDFNVASLKEAFAETKPVIVQNKEDIIRLKLTQHNLEQNVLDIKNVIKENGKEMQNVVNIVSSIREDQAMQYQVQKELLTEIRRMNR